MIIFSSLQVRRGVRVLLDNSSATINPGQKVGLVGKNGCGKSTLFSLLKGELDADAGNVTIPPNWVMAWVNQETPASDIPAIEYVIDGDREFRQIEQQLSLAYERNDGNEIGILHSKLDVIQAWDIQARAAALLDGLGFTQQQLQQPVRNFSGGWRMRLNLAQALICRADLLLLDEPTNHLDLDAVIWLEKWLQSFTGTLILISHDRDFLDPIINKVLHIEQQQLFEYSGNYSSFERQRAAKLAQQQSLYQQQQARVAHLQSYIDRFRAKASKARQAQSRIKMLERMEMIASAHVDNPFHFNFRKPDSLPSPLLKLNNVSVGYADKLILNKIKLNLVPGSRIGLLGKNGAGKSTLVKLLAGTLAPLQGEVSLAKEIKLGYFAQHQLEYLRADQTPLWHMMSLAPQEKEQVLRNFLGGFGFRGDKVNEITEYFSGGEKARLVLALIVWQRPNLLLLDEPTNHLDLDMRQALTDALLDFEGALILVSHDRHLLRATTDEFYLVHNGQVAPFEGDLTDYQHWLTEQQKQRSGSVSKVVEEVNHEPAENKKDKKRREADLRMQTQPLRKQLEKCEQQMMALEQQLNDIETKLATNHLYEAAYKKELTDLLEQQVLLKHKKEEMELEWFDLHDKLDKTIQLFN